MGGLCKACEDALGELIGDEEHDSGRLIHIFECSNCGHQWRYSTGL